MGASFKFKQSNFKMDLGNKAKSGLTLTLLGAFLLVGFQNCGAQEVHTTGGMTQDLKLDLTSATTEQISAAYKAVLGRMPTSAEVARYLPSLTAGAMSAAQLRTQLAQSDEARAAVSTLLAGQSGSSVNSQVLAQWLSALGTNVTLADLTVLLGGSHI